MKRERLKSRLFKLQDGLCHLCKEPMKNYLSATIDHVIPSSKGGSDHPDNIALAHFFCNNLRGNNDIMPAAYYVGMRKNHRYKKEKPQSKPPDKRTAQIVVDGDKRRFLDSRGLCFKVEVITTEK